MAGTSSLVQTANAPGLTIAVYDGTLATTCDTITGFSLIVAVIATYKVGAAAQALTATWSGKTVTVTGAGAAVDTLNIVVYGII